LANLKSVPQGKKPTAEAETADRAEPVPAASATKPPPKKAVGLGAHAETRIACQRTQPLPLHVRTMVLAGETL